MLELFVKVLEEKSLTDIPAAAVENSAVMSLAAGPVADTILSGPCIWP